MSGLGQFIKTNIPDQQDLARIDPDGSHIYTIQYLPDQNTWKPRPLKSRFTKKQNDEIIISDIPNITEFNVDEGSSQAKYSRSTRYSPMLHNISSNGMPNIERIPEYPTNTDNFLVSDIPQKTMNSVSADSGNIMRVKLGHPLIISNISIPNKVPEQHRSMIPPESQDRLVTGQPKTLDPPQPKIPDPLQPKTLDHLQPKILDHLQPTAPVTQINHTQFTQPNFTLKRSSANRIGMDSSQLQYLTKSQMIANEDIPGKKSHSDMDYGHFGAMPTAPMYSVSIGSPVAIAPSTCTHKTTRVTRNQV